MIHLHSPELLDQITAASEDMLQDGEHTMAGYCPGCVRNMAEIQLSHHAPPAPPLHEDYTDEQTIQYMRELYDWGERHFCVGFMFGVLLNRETSKEQSHDTAA